MAETARTQRHSLSEQAAEWAVCMSGEDVSVKQQADFEAWLAQDKRHRKPMPRLRRMMSGKALFCTLLYKLPKKTLFNTFSSLCCACHSCHFVRQAFLYAELNFSKNINLATRFFCSCVSAIRRQFFSTLF
ncbi:MAG TPA: FecR/PupR family sigma factor regulator [Nitrosomonas sp.]|nr:FecR/PupR family sigma factor regulator [Nitrosomonas sp.]